MGFAVLCVIVFELFAQASIQIFINDQETVSMGMIFLRINCLETPETSCQGLFNQIHKKATKKCQEALSCS